MLLLLLLIFYALDVVVRRLLCVLVVVGVMISMARQCWLAHVKFCWKIDLNRGGTEMMRICTRKEL